MRSPKTTLSSPFKGWFNTKNNIDDKDNKMTNMALYIITFIITSSYFIHLLLPLSDSKQYVNLIPDIPYVLNSKYRNFKIRTNFNLEPNGYKCYACDQVQENNQKVVKKLSFKFHNNFQEFKFRTTGYSSFNLTIDSEHPVQIYQQAQKQHRQQQSFICTSIICEFVIQNLDNQDNFVQLQYHQFHKNISLCRQILPISENEYQIELGQGQQLVIDTESNQFDWGLYNNNNKIKLYHKTLPNIWYITIFIAMNSISVVIFAHTILICLNKKA